MRLSADDRSAITELISLHGHLFDEGELDRLDELFTPDVVYDVRDFGLEPLRGSTRFARPRCSSAKPARWRTMSPTS